MGLRLRGTLQPEYHFLPGITLCLFYSKGRQGSLEMARGLPLLPSQPGQGKSRPPEASQCN